MIQNLIIIPEPYKDRDFSDLKKFIEIEKKYLDYFPVEIINKNNLARLVNLLYNHYGSVNFPLNAILPLFHKVNEVLRVIICLSGHEIPDLSTVQPFNQYYPTFIFELLNHCDSTTRLEEFMKYKNIWSRFYKELLNHQELKEKYKEIFDDLLSVYKESFFLSVLLRKRHKVFLEDKSDKNLDTLYKNNLEKAIEKDEYFSSSSKYSIKVKKMSSFTLYINIK